jgi:acetyl esterase/lipase
MLKNYIEQFLFFPSKEINKTPENINIPYKNIYLKKDGSEINKNNKLDKDNYEEYYHGWFIEGHGKNSITNGKCILFIHGNAGNISYRLNYIQKFYELGFSLMFFDYPGFGESYGTPNEENCIECAHLFYKYLIGTYNLTASNIILYGESIGGSIATSLANLCNVKYLILQSTFTDIKLIVKKIVNLSYFDFFITNNIGFETLENLKHRFKLNILNKKMKTYIIHSSEDEIINISHSESLSKYSDKYYLCNGPHSNVTMDSDFIFHILSFIKE